MSSISEAMARDALRSTWDRVLYEVYDDPPDPVDGVVALLRVLIDPATSTALVAWLDAQLRALLEDAWAMEQTMREAA